MIQESKTGVLVVIEKRETKSLVVNSLSQIDVTYFVTSSGDDAVKICRQNENIEVVVIDADLNGFTGFEALHEIRKIRSEMKAIALVNDHLQAEVYKSYGFTNCILLPFNETIFSDNIRMLFSLK